MALQATQQRLNNSTMIDSSGYDACLRFYKEMGNIHFEPCVPTLQRTSRTQPIRYLLETELTAL